MTIDKLSIIVAAINRAAMQKQVSTITENTVLGQKILLMLITLGYLRGFTILSRQRLRVYLKFDKYGQPVLRNLSRVSKPGNRVYVRIKQISKSPMSHNAFNAGTLCIVSTSQGLKLSTELYRLKIGGEILLSIK